MLADIYTSIIASAYLVGIEQRLGAEFLEEKSAPPRMVWVPVSDSFVAGDNGKRSTTDRLLRSLATRVARMRIRILVKGDVDTATDDIREVETILRNLIAAISTEAHGDFAIEGGEWVSSDGAESFQYGRAYDLTVSFNIPLYRDPVVDGVTTVGPPLTQSNADLLKDFGPEGND